MRDIAVDSDDTSTARLFSSRKNKIIAGALFTLVLVAAGLIMYTIVVTPARKPFRAAQAQYQSVYNANVQVITLGGSLNAGSATDEAFDKSTNALKEGLERLAAENKALGTYEVLKDGEGKKRYEAFSKQIDRYVSFNTDMVTSMQKVRPVIFGCSAKMSIAGEASTGVTEMRSCAEGLAALTDIPNEQYRTYAKEASAQYEALAQNFEKRMAIATTEFAPGYDPKKELDAERDQIVEELGAVGTRFAKSLNEAKKKVDITEASMALDEYLADKSSAF